MSMLHENVQMDILPLSITFSVTHKYLFVIDCFIKWMVAFPLNNIRAKTVSDIFLNQIIFRHEFPKSSYRSREKF